MKKRVFFATLSALMLLAMIAVSVFPSFAADAVYYPNGTIILNEDLLNCSICIITAMAPTSFPTVMTIPTTPKS